MQKNFAVSLSGQLEMASLTYIDDIFGVPIGIENLEILDAELPKMLSLLIFVWCNAILRRGYTPND